MLTEHRHISSSITRAAGPSSWLAKWRPLRGRGLPFSRYGLSFWLNAIGPAVLLEDYDVGVSIRTVHDPASDTTRTVIASWTDGAWP